MSRNPILTDKAFDPANYGSTTTGASPAEEWQRAQAGHGMATGSVDARLQGGVPSGPVVTEGRTMTMGGTAWATLMLLAVAGAVGVYGWSTVTETPIPLAEQVVGEPTVSASMNQPVVFFVAIFAALGVALLTAFKPKLARFTAVLYAALEGYVLGTISHLFDAQFNGIVVQAILGTAGVFLTMLALYGLRILRVTPRMTKAIVGATFGILIMYGVAFIASLFGADMGFVYGTDGGAFGIVLSLVIVGVAAFNLLLDFDFIERGSKSGLPSYMEWYGAFGLMVTLVWIYIEMLRLFARLRN